jgi:hypothetical protein
LENKRRKGVRCENDPEVQQDSPTTRLDWEEVDRTVLRQREGTEC